MPACWLILIYCRRPRVKQKSKGFAFILPNMDAVACREPSVERHGHGAEVLTDTACHRGSDADCGARSLLVEPNEPRARRCGTQNAKDASHVPACLVKLGIELATEAHAHFEPYGIRDENFGARPTSRLSERHQCRDKRGARVRDHWYIIIIEELRVSAGAIGEGSIEHVGLPALAENRRVLPPSAVIKGERSDDTRDTQA